MTFMAFIGPLGTPEMIGIFLLVLLLFGAKKLPELARGLGRSLGEFRKAKDEFEDEITRSQDELEVAAQEDKKDDKKDEEKVADTSVTNDAS